MTDPFEEMGRAASRRSALQLAAAGTLSATLLAWGADVIKGAASALLSDALGSTPSYISQLIVGLAFLLLGGFVAYRVAIPAARRAFLNSIADVRPGEKAVKCRALVLTLSDLPLTDSLRPGQTDHVALAKEAIKLAKKTTTTEERLAVLNELCAAEKKWGVGRWLWQQPLRLLRHNFGTVEAIGFILSKEAEPQLASLMLPLLNALMPNTTVLTDHEPVDLSDYNAVTRALDRTCEALLEATDCKPKDLCIDITSGTKAYSAAATVKTLNSAAIFSYVETVNPYKVLTYDASITI